MELSKAIEIKDFLLNPVKENIRNKRVSDNAYYLNKIRKIKSTERTWFQQRINYSQIDAVKMNINYVINTGNRVGKRLEIH